MLSDIGGESLERMPGSGCPANQCRGWDGGRAEVELVNPLRCVLKQGPLHKHGGAGWKGGGRGATQSEGLKSLEKLGF